MCFTSFDQSLSETKRVMGSDFTIIFQFLDE
jgi:hypothetical protein